VANERMSHDVCYAILSHVIFFSFVCGPLLGPWAMGAALRFRPEKAGPQRGRFCASWARDAAAPRTGQEKISPVATHQKKKNLLDTLTRDWSPTFVWHAS